MDLPSIKLVMLQGPREGEALEFRPGITIRIGRLVRGNNLVIKDAGVSSKHLVIEAQGGKWILRDLGSSNGTILNSKTIDAETPIDLRDGDIVKVGEETSFTINIDDRQEADSRVSGMKRGEEEVESRRRNPSRRARSTKSQTEMSEQPENIHGRVGGRVTRSRKNDDSLNCVGVTVKVLENPEIEVKKGRGRGCRKKGKAQEELDEKETRQVELDEKETQQVEYKETNSSGNERIDVEKAQRLVGNFPSHTNTNFQQHNEIQEANFEEEDVIRLNGKHETAEVNPVRQEVYLVEGRDELQNGSSSSKVIMGLQKMTLGQWLDYMEVHYPKQIIKETDEMIEEMKRKAEKVKEYIIQQKRDRAMPSKG